MDSDPNKQATPTEPVADAGATPPTSQSTPDTTPDTSAASTPAVPGTGDAATPSQPSTAPAKKAPTMMILWIVLALVVIGGALWFFLMRK